MQGLPQVGISHPNHSHCHRPKQPPTARSWREWTWRITRRPCTTMTIATASSHLSSPMRGVWESTMLNSIVSLPPVQRHVPPSVAIRRRAPDGDRADGQMHASLCGAETSAGQGPAFGAWPPSPTASQQASQPASPRIEKPAAPSTERSLALAHALACPLHYAPHAAAATYRSQLLSCGSSLCRSCHPQGGLGSSRRSRSRERTGQPSALLLTHPLSLANAAKHGRGRAGLRTPAAVAVLSRPSVSPRGHVAPAKRGARTQRGLSALSISSSRRPASKSGHRT